MKTLSRFLWKTMETQEDIMKFFEERPDSKFNDDEGILKISIWIIMSLISSNKKFVIFQH